MGSLISIILAISKLLESMKLGLFNMQIVSEVRYIFIVCTLSGNSGPQGFCGYGENDYFFSGCWGALVIILGDLEQAHSFWDLGSPAKK